MHTFWKELAPLLTQNAARVDPPLSPDLQMVGPTRDLAVSSATLLQKKLSSAEVLLLESWWVASPRSPFLQWAVGTRGGVGTPAQK
jgi:hypothetical protein